MTTPDLFFTRIEVRQMPGFPTGGLCLDNLSPGVNIVYGPNASGKSTLARVIQKLLRPTDPPHEQQKLFVLRQFLLPLVETRNGQDLNARREALLHHLHRLRHLDPLLLHRVAVADGLHEMGRRLTR